jgi:serine protease DegS
VERSLGSGVIVDTLGHIVTNHHVIANADSIKVQLADGRVADAHIVGRDPDTDLAVLQISLTPLPVATLGRSDRLRVGDVVLAIGDPIGLSQSVTHGIVSATGREQLGIATFEDFIQTDAAINFGNSGGALIDTTGALVGINTAIVAKNLGVEGIGFAIPVNLVRGVLNDIVAHGRVIRGWLGIVPEDVTDSQAHELGLAQGGVLVSNLYVGSPAQQAGLQPGDILLAIDATPLRNAQETLARVALVHPGATLTIRALRGRQTIELHAKVSEPPTNR